MKLKSKTLLGGMLLGATCAVSHAAVLYRFDGPVTVNETWNYAPPGMTLSRGPSASDTLYFRYTVTNPASNDTTESYYAGMSFFYQGGENLGVGNGWDPWAYSAFSGGIGNLDLNSANPEPSANYQQVRSTDVTTIVFRVSFVDGGNDNITVWLNPDLNLTEGGQSSALTTSFSANATFDTIYLREGGGGDGWTYSTFAIADSFSEIAAVPEPAAMLLGSFGFLGLVRRRR